MEQKKRFIFLLVFIVALCLLFAPMAAQAYVLPGKQLLQFTTKALGGARTLRCSVDAVTADPENLTETTRRTGVLFFDYPGHFREDQGEGDKATMIKALSPLGFVAIENGRVAADAKGPRDHFMDLLLYRDPRLLAEKLQLLGVDVELTSLGRFEGRIVYIIGALYPDETAPQVWVDKDSFLPLRLIVTRQQGPGETPGVEIRYLNWRVLGNENKRYAMARFPVKIQVFEKGMLVSERALTGWKINADPPQNHFDTPMLKASYPPAEYLLEENKEPMEIDKALEEFKRISE